MSTQQNATSGSSDSSEENKGGRVVVLLVLGLLLVFGGGYALLAWQAGDKVARGTTVEGVEIGSLTRADAEQKLRDELSKKAEADLTLRVNDKVSTVSAEDLGMALDYPGTVDAAIPGSRWSPARVWGYWTGSGERDPELDFDEPKLEERLLKLSTQFAKASKDGDVTFVDGKVEVAEPVAGRAIDTETAIGQLEKAYLGDTKPVSLALTDQEPDISSDDVEEAVQSFANPAMSGPVTLRFAKTPVKLSPEEFGDVLGMKPEDGKLVPDLDRKKLTEVLGNHVEEKDKPRDATVKLVNGKPEVVPSRPGVVYDPQTVGEAFLSMVTKPVGEREMEVKSRVAKPKFTTQDARDLQIKEKIASFPTYYPPASYRDTNIGRAAELIDGTVLKPGETFSLNDTVGERTAANGFTDGFIISDGIFKSELGGGVSQMATTLYNAGFFGGLQDVEHKAHSFYIDRYPVGREATVAWGSVDMRFKNNTPYGVLIHTYIHPSSSGGQGSVTAELYSTKIWDIEAKTSDRYAFTSPNTRTLTAGPDCVPNSGYGGFDVDITRIFRKAGQSAVERTEKYTTTYTPSDTVICKPPEPPKPAPKKKPGPKKPGN